MPFQSEKQRRWMYANQPETARRWEKDTPKGKKPPESVGKYGPSRGLVGKLTAPEIQPVLTGRLALPVRGAAGPSNHEVVMPDFASLYASPEAQQRQDAESKQSKQRRQASWRDFNTAGMHGAPPDAPELRYSEGKTSIANIALTQPRHVISTAKLRQNRAQLSYKTVAGG